MRALAGLVVLVAIAGCLGSSQDRPDRVGPTAITQLPTKHGFGIALQWSPPGPRSETGPDRIALGPGECVSFPYRSSARGYTGEAIVNVFVDVPRELAASLNFSVEPSRLMLSAREAVNGTVAACANADARSITGFVLLSATTDRPMDVYSVNARVEIDTAASGG